MAKQNTSLRRSAENQKITALVLKVLATYGQLHSHGLRLTRPFKQSPVRWQIMGVLAQESLTVSQVARRIGSTRQGVQRIVDGLAQEHLVELRTNPDHARSPKLLLTKEGQRILDLINAGQSVWADKLAKGMDITKVTAATETLAQFGEVLLRTKRVLFRE